MVDDVLRDVLLGARELVEAGGDVRRQGLVAAGRPAAWWRSSAWRDARFDAVRGLLLTSSRVMQRLATRLDGLVLLAPTVHGDERGFFVETFRADAWARARRPDGVRAGQPLALAPRHAARHPLPDRTPARASSCACARGRVLDVVVDLRRGSPTFGEWEGVRARRRPRPPAVDPGRLRARLLRALARSPTSSTSARTTTTRRPRRASASTTPTSASSGRGRRAALLASATATRRGWPRSPTTLPFTRVTRRPLRAEPDRRRCTSATCARRCWRGCSRARPGARFLVRMEDLDPGRVRDGLAERAARRPGGDRARLGRRGRRASRRGSTLYAEAIALLRGRAASTSASARGRRSARRPRRRTGRCPRAPIRARACG